MNTPHIPGQHLDHPDLASVKWMDAAQARLATLEAQRNELREALEMALPYVEMAEHDESYKKGAVLKIVTTIRTTLNSTTL